MSSPLYDRELVIAQIAEEEKYLATLWSNVEERTNRLKALREKLSGFPVDTPCAGQREVSAGSISNAQKVSLFRSLFRGREDVFPKRWDNPKSGRTGYSPACSNEWAWGLCEKKRTSTDRKGKAVCADCANQAFLPVSDEEVAKHLKGHQVMGVYPLLLDETCWLLAVDFDKQGWQEDITAFIDTIQANGLPVAIERSRSGNGAHAWFFFSAPVQAALARKMGCFIITETMNRRHQVSMESYDRLFPNQDTLPKGGFGNLIALPLQHAARERGNSVFIDSSFTPYVDQWAFLAGIQKIDPMHLETLVDEATRHGRIIGVRTSGMEDERERTLWCHQPSRPISLIPITEPLPSEVRAVICQRLFVERAGLPSPLLCQLKRLAAFHNPEFYKRQKMRLSTSLTPRVIACAEDLAEHLVLPRGCLPEAEELLRQYGIRLALEDKRMHGEPIELEFQGTLTPLQESAIAAMLPHDLGVCTAPPGVGKTVIAAYLIAKRAKNTLILVHRKPLLDQWIAQLALFLGIKPEEIGCIGGGKRRPNGRLDVAMLQTLFRKEKVDDLVAGYGHVIVDECHHLPAFSFERVLNEVKARFLAGLTATPQRRDGHQPIIHMQLGPVRFAVDAKSSAVGRPFEHRLIVRETGFRWTDPEQEPSIQELYAALAADASRNELIFEDIIRALEEKRSPIVLTERRDHLEQMFERLRKFTRNLVLLHGGMKTKERREAVARLATLGNDEERLLIATGRFIGEGFDDARSDTLFLALPVSWKGTLVQYTGRLHRLHPGKTEVRIYDYVDREIPVLRRMFERRLRSYRAIGYRCSGEQLDTETPSNEPVVEYDEEALAAISQDDDQY